MATQSSITDEQIVALSTGAAEAGDLAMVAVCRRALDTLVADQTELPRDQRIGDEDAVSAALALSIDAARAECVRVIAEAEAARWARQQCEALARTLGATLDTSNGEVNCEAPAGFIWTSDGVHELVNSPWDNETQADMFREAIRRMDMGLEPCEVPNCDWCGERTR